MTQKKEHIILIHGTFAYEDAWWQKDSSFVEYLTKLADYVAGAA